MKLGDKGRKLWLRLTLNGSAHLLQLLFVYVYGGSGGGGGSGREGRCGNPAYISQIFDVM